MKSRHAYRIALALTASMAYSAQADFVSPESWTRGDGGTTYQAWDVFSSFTDAAPDVASVNANGTASLTENTGTGFVTSGGNIYSFGGTTDFTVTIPEADVPIPEHNVTAIVQIRTQGTELDYNSVLLNGQAAVDVEELDRVSLGGFGGALVDTWFLFNVAYADFGDGVPGVEELTLEFAASGSSLSLDRLEVDTAIRPFGFYDEPNPSSIPEPASLVLMGLAGVVMLRRR